MPTVIPALPAPPTLLEPDTNTDDDSGRIQAAIDALGTEGGVVQFAAGTFEVNSRLRIEESGIVLRGAGQGVDGTVIKAAFIDSAGNPYQQDLILAGYPRTAVSRQAEDYSAQSGVTTTADSEAINDVAVNNITNGDWLQFHEVDLSDAFSLAIRMSGIHDGSTVKIRTGSLGPEGTEVGSCTAPNTGSWTTYETISCPIVPLDDAEPDKQDLFLVFERGDSQGIGRVDYLRTRIWSVAEGTQRKVSSAYVPSGATVFTVAGSVPYSVGDKIMIVRHPTQEWIDAMNAGIRSDSTPWTATEFDEFTWERVITGVSGNELTIDVPLVQALNGSWDDSYVVKAEVPRLTQIGIEHLRLESSFAHDTDELHGWNAILMESVENSWVRNVTGKYFGYSLVRLMNSRSVTVQDTALTEPKSLIQGSRRYAYSISGISNLNLFQRTYASESRHAHVMGQRVPGPNVFLDALSEYPYNEDGPHQDYATGVLYDNIRAKHHGPIRVRNTGVWQKDGHGWTGAQVVYWNNKADSEIWVDSPPGALSFALGSIGASDGSTASSRSGRYEDWGGHVTPRSLYLQQLTDRLGQSLTDTVASREQQYGTIWNKLSSWKGEPFVVDDSFDATTSGQVPSGWTVDAAGGVVQVDVPPIPTDPPNKHLLLFDYNKTNTSSYVTASRVFSSPTTTVMIEFKVNFSTTSDYFYASVYGSGTEAIRLRADNGVLQVQNGSSYKTLQSFSANTWYRIRIVADPAAAKAEIYINGSLRDVQGDFKSAVTFLDRLEFKTHSSGTGSIFVDDVWVSRRPALLSENFDAMATNGTPSPWTQTAGSTKVVEVPTSTDKSMELLASGTELVTASREFSPTDTRVTIEYKVKFGSTTSLAGTYYNQVYGCKEPIHADDRNGKLKKAIVLRAQSGQLTVATGDPSSPTYIATLNGMTLPTYAGNQWYTIKIVAYPELLQADVYVDNQLEVTVPFLTSDLILLRQVAFAIDPTTSTRKMNINDLTIKN